MIKFSLVIPIHNNEDTLATTLNSVIINKNIQDDEFECILSDEGSTDNSSEICLQYAAKYAYFKYYPISTDGGERLVKSKNFGKKVANGKYVMFLSAGDILCQDFVKDVVEFMDNNLEYEFYLCNRRIFNSMYWHVIDEFDIYGPSLSSCIFRKQLTDLYDFEDVYCTDIVYTKRILMEDNKFYYNPDNKPSYDEQRNTGISVDEKIASQYDDWRKPIIKQLQYSRRYNYCLGNNNQIIDKRGKKINNIEIYAANHCNLNCAYCANFSTLEKNKTPIPIDYIINELKHLQKYQDDLLRISFLGGEPMLHPKLDVIFDIARQMLPNIEIRMITNGTLYKRLYKLKDSIARNNIYVDVSVYPVENTKDITYAFRQLIPEYLLVINEIPSDLGFYTKHLMGGYHNEMEKIKQCILRNNCTRLDGDRLYLCEYAANLHLLKEYYPEANISLTNEGAYIMLSDDITVDDIVNFCYNSVPDLCHHCATVLQETGEHYKLWETKPWHLSQMELSEFYVD